MIPSSLEDDLKFDLILGAKRIQDCQVYEGFEEHFNVIRIYASYMEENFECSGLCSRFDYYLYSNV
jgi:hypothetical protein